MAAEYSEAGTKWELMKDAKRVHSGLAICATSFLLAVSQAPGYFWQLGQKAVPRPATTTRAMIIPQREQGWPCLP